MKKTMIAAAVAALVAAPAAFAEVTVSGHVLQEFIFDDDATANSATANDTGLNGEADAGLTFSASEDLGNGMSAFARIVIGTDNIGDGGGVAGNDTLVGLRGSFGTITTGRMEGFTEGQVHAMASVDSADNASIEVTGGAPAAGDALAYVSPSFNGLTVGIAGYADHSGLGETDDAFSATDIMVAYSAGPLTVRAAMQSIDNAALSTAPATTGLGEDTVSVGAQYTMDALTLRGVYTSADDVDGNAADDRDGWMVGMNYAMGNNVVGLGMSSQETNAAGAENDAWIVDLTHNMSSRTRVYATYLDRDNAGTDSSELTVGMRHAF